MASKPISRHLVPPGGRSGGKTRRMVLLLPKEGAVIVVHIAPMANYVRQMIYDLRGPDFEASCTVVTIDELRRHGLPRRRDRIFVDHTAEDRLGYEVTGLIDHHNQRACQDEHRLSAAPSWVGIDMAVEIGISIGISAEEKAPAPGPSIAEFLWDAEVAMKAAKD